METGYEIRTFPGAPEGKYEIRVEGEQPLEFDVTFSDPDDDSSSMFLFDRYTDGHDIERAGVGDEVAYGFMNYPPQTTIPLVMFRSDSPVEHMEDSQYHLVDRLEVSTDDRGHAALAFTVTEGSSGHCFYLMEERMLGYVDPNYGFQNLGDGDGNTLCIAFDPDQAPPTTTTTSSTTTTTFLATDCWGNPLPTERQKSGQRAVRRCGE